MHIISEKKLREFWERRPETEEPLRAWIRVTHRAGWKSFADVRSAYAHADVVGPFVVFNIGGNKYRLITAIHYNRQLVFTLMVLTHAEYSKNKWRSVL